MSPLNNFVELKRRKKEKEYSIEPNKYMKMIIKFVLFLGWTDNRKDSLPKYLNFFLFRTDS